ncbi:MAG: hypothetical protein JST80_05185 [Bdellovibrionales bacterium]|nr:hypothetical protein [Bdellovibrionales bacterium]
MKREGNFKAMRRYLFLMMLPIALAFAGNPSSKSERIDRICAEKEKTYGKAYIGCNGFDSGVVPLSASYQQHMVEPMGVKRSELNEKFMGDVRYNPAPAALKRPNFEFTGGGSRYGYDEAPLADRWLAIVEDLTKDDQNACSGLLNDWFHTKWASQFNPSGTDPVAGRCFIWSAWAMDRKVVQSLQNIDRGTMCKGMPLTLGEIKEIYLTLYDTPLDPVQMNRQKVISGEKGKDGFVKWSSLSPKTIMDTNIGLSTLGVLGNGVEPARMFEDFKSAVSAGKSFRFNRDQTQVWNQPIALMVDTAYKNSSTSPEAEITLGSVLSSADLSAKEGDPEAKKELTSLVQEERDLIIRLAAGEMLSAKAKELVKRRSQLIDGGSLVPTKGTNIVLHDLTVEYGDELSFGSTDPNLSKQISYRYAAVEDADHRVVRSSWKPPVTKFGDFCDKHKDDRIIEFPGMLSLSKKEGNNPPLSNKNCSSIKRTGKDLLGNTGDYEVFDGAVPPEYYDTVPAEPAFKDPMQKCAYGWFQSVIQDPNKCPTFDNALKFTDEFQRRTLDNSLSDADIAVLAPMYKDADFIDAAWIKNNLCDSRYARVDVLRNKIPGFDASICR